MKTNELPMSVWIIIGFFVIFVCFWVVGQGGVIIAYDRVAELAFIFLFSAWASWYLLKNRRFFD